MALKRGMHWYDQAGQLKPHSAVFGALLCRTRERLARHEKQRRARMKKRLTSDELVVTIRGNVGPAIGEQDVEAQRLRRLLS